MEGYLDYVISLEVRGYAIAEEDISSLLGLKCTEFYDEKIRPDNFVKSIEDVWSHNLWVYTVETSQEFFESELKLFLKKINPKKLNNSQYSISDVRLHIIINSSYAQIHLPLTQVQIQELAHLGINVDINIVSLGCIKNNDRDS